MRIFVFLFCAALLHAQQTPDQGKQIVDAAVAALGGDNFLHMQNRVETGRFFSFFREQVSGYDYGRIYTKYPSNPSGKGLNVIERESFGKKKEQYAVLLLPNQAWDLTYRGARLIGKEDWSKYERTTRHDIFYILRTRYNEPGMEFDYAGTDTSLGLEAKMVDITDAQGEKIRVWFNAMTKLPMRQSYTWMDPETRYRNDEVTDFDKYRDIGDGIQWPYTISRQRNGYKSFEMFADDVKANQPLPDKLFELPPGVKVLKKVD